MQNAQYESIKLKTGIDPNFLADTLTTDIELTDALFDLIDNSIDAARNEIISRGCAKDDYGLPNDYSKFKIKLRFGSQSIIVEDNCVGFENAILTNSAFYTGKRSHHEFGIGHYGLGLKRALLKAGRTYAMITDNGDFLYKSKFNINTFSGEESESLIAKKYNTTDKKRTLFIVTDLYPNILSQIKDTEWMANAINELSIRYSIFIRKGLKIIISNSQGKFPDTFLIKPSVPGIRNDGLINVIKDKITTYDVNCEFCVGIHDGYTFPGEASHKSEENKKLTKSYGIYYIFNDRVIVAASKEAKHGFTTHWHSEYGGFVCLAFVIGKDPKNLPWNTAKTEVKINNPLFLQIRRKIEPLAQEYRKQAKLLINIWTKTQGFPLSERKRIFLEKTINKKINDTELYAISRKNKISNNKIPQDKLNNLPKNESGKDNEGKLEPLIKTAKESKISAKNNKNAHVKDWVTLLPEHFPVTPDNYILNNLIVEATTLKMDDAPHASCMLYRSLFEAAFKHFIKQNNLFFSVKEHYYTKGEGVRKNHNEEYKKRQSLELSMCSAWILHQKDDFYPLDGKRKLSLSSKKLKDHIPTMNGVVHGNQFIGNDGEIQKIRNETVSLLEFLTLGKIHS